MIFHAVTFPSHSFLAPYPAWHWRGFGSWCNRIPCSHSACQNFSPQCSNFHPIIVLKVCLQFSPYICPSEPSISPITFPNSLYTFWVYLQSAEMITPLSTMKFWWDLLHCGLSKGWIKPLIEWLSFSQKGFRQMNVITFRGVWHTIFIFHYSPFTNSIPSVSGFISRSSHSQSVLEQKSKVLLLK